MDDCYEIVDNYVAEVIEKAICEARATEEAQATTRTTTSALGKVGFGKCGQGRANTHSSALDRGKLSKGGYGSGNTPSSSLRKGCSGGSGQRPRSRSPMTGGQRVPFMRGGVAVHQLETELETIATSTLDEVTGKIYQVVAQAVADQAKKSSITAVDQQAITRPAPPASPIGITKPTAHHLSEALLEALQSTETMRQTLDIYLKAARGNEALLERAQHLMNDIIGGSH